MKINLKSFDIIILNDVVAGYIAGIFLKKKFLKKSKYIVHGSEGRYFFNDSSIKSKLFLNRIFYTRLIRHVGEIVCVSENGKDRFLSQCPQSLKLAIENKIVVKYAGIDSSVFEEVDKKIINPSILKVIEGKTVMLSVGRLIKGKGYDQMINEFDHASRLNKDICWLIVGKGPYKSEMQEKINKLQLSDKIIFIGYIERKQLSHYFSVSDIFWLLSPIEALGLVYLEASNFGVPSIGVNKLGGGEIIKSGVNGAFLESFGELQNLINILSGFNKDAIVEYANTYQSYKFSNYLMGEV